MRVAISGSANSCELELVEPGDVVEPAAPHFTADTVRIRNVEHGVSAAPQLYALESRGQESAPPIEVVKYLPAACSFADRRHHQKRGQAFRLRSQPITGPGAHGRPPGNLAATEQKTDRGGMIHGVGVHALDEAQLIDDFGRVGQELAHPGGRLAILGERFDGASISLPCGLPVMLLNRLPPTYSSGTGWPCICWSLGFQSKRSTCVGAPF